MEYLVSIKDSLKNINESNIKYINVFKQPNMVYGNVFDSDYVNFRKVTDEMIDEMKTFGDNYFNSMNDLKDVNCGNRIRFKTTSRRLVFRVELKKQYNNKNMVYWNSSGFDIYVQDKKGKYKNYSLIAPKEGYRIFAEQIILPSNSAVCIFLPNNNPIQNLYLGIEKKSKIYKFPYPKDKAKPLLFYGNGTTQGISASKSGNSYPNIVSKILNHNIINISINNCCLATPKTIDLLNNIDFEAIIIDYSRDAPNLKYFKDTYEKLYKNIRQKHTYEKIILMSAVYLNQWKEYKEYDKVIYETYKNAVKRNENVYLLNQMDLFEEEEYDLVAIDVCHYNDIGMFRIAEKICEILTKG